ncbi:hypothetical protein NB311A_12122 [Nitrobacter sp. Nb-311A]|nr:hypothetical protein NB311A_12122 [Nitrobacter sp. Nb-311A]
MPGLSDQEGLLAMNAGLLTIRDLFDGLET